MKHKKLIEAKPLIEQLEELDQEEKEIIAQVEGDLKLASFFWFYTCYVGSWKQIQKGVV